MLIFKVDIYSLPKPAGKLGRYGNITQNKNSYIPWKRILAGHLRNQAQSMMSLRQIKFPLIPYGIVLYHQVDSLRCGDLLNINGAVIDAIKEAGILKDDSPKNLCKFSGSMTKSDSNKITIYVCLDRESYLQAIQVNQ